MRLQSIRIAGFKSFAEPTLIDVPNDLSGIVGPNGCGKSNIIDAVRWVLGESSARQLRGKDSTAVIFHGSASRKAISMASVELLFDNSEGRIGGEFANFAEIAVKREINSEGNNSYVLNGQRCRRKDVISLFLGTGLGPRSYAIIEQGMITRLLDAKPDELRGFLEEAAGISIYKERRRETEISIRHTQENLERLNDIRNEVDTRMRALKRQSAEALQYRTLKHQHRQLKQTIAALALAVHTSNLTNNQLKHAESVAEKEKHTSALRQLENKKITHDQTHAKLQQRLDSGIANRQKISIQLTRAQEQRNASVTQKQQLEQQLQQHSNEYERVQQTITVDEAQLLDLQNNANTLQQQRDTQQQTLQQQRVDTEVKQQTFLTTRRRFDAAHAQVHQQKNQAEIARIQLEQLINTQTELTEKHTALTSKQFVDTQPLHQQVKKNEQQHANNNKQINTIEMQIRENDMRMRTSEHKVATLEKEQRTFYEELQITNGKRASIQVLLARDTKHVALEHPAWLTIIQVTAGWEIAFESVAAMFLQSYALTTNEQFKSLPNTPLAAIVLATHQPTTSATPLLSDVVAGPLPAHMGDYLVAQSLADAWQLQANITPQQVIVVKDGTLLGNNWIYKPQQMNAASTAIAQQAQLQQLTTRADTLTGRIEEQLQLITHYRNRITSAKDTTSQQRLHLNTVQNANRDIQIQVSQLRSQIEKAESEQQRIATERERIDGQLQSIVSDINEKKLAWNAALQQATAHDADYQQLVALHQQYEREFASSNKLLQQHQTEFHAVDKQLSTSTQTITNVAQSVARAREQQQRHQQHIEDINTQLVAVRNQPESINAAIQQLLSEHVLAEEHVKNCQHDLQQCKAELQENSKNIATATTAIATCVQHISQLEVQQAVFATEQKNIQQQFVNVDLHAALKDIDSSKPIETYQQQSERVDAKLQKMGNVNLVADTEYQTEFERKVYLDCQYDDLTQSIDKLESAIIKINKETRETFANIFAQVNASLNTLFPTIFGGGEARLALTDSDLLTAGVQVIAQPPGKRAVQITQLSGGEKTMVAIALIFALFKLNPAPFCLLDEVDAPLDDVNVIRFCDLLKEITKQVQCILITHNKTTMENMQSLLGVTMYESGVSRIVGVDIHQALEMAEA